MSYEYNKYTCNINTLKKTLDKYGVAILPNIINQQECDNINDGVWDFFEYISQDWIDPLSPIKRDDAKTWKHIYKLFPLRSQLFKGFNSGHAQVSWTVRQNLNIINIFAKLWDCTPEDLLVSFDSFSFCLPPEITNKGWENKSWFHTDQSYTRNNMECIQSWITANDVEEGDGTLAVMEGSHKYHKEFSEKFNINDKSDWYKLNSIEEQFYVNKKCDYKKIKCPKGSLVLWDSRTIHCGSNPIKKRKNPNTRAVIYLCYMPKILCSDKQLEKKKHLFYNKRTTNHWPCKSTPVSEKPNTYGEKLPDITEIDDPVLNDIGMSLAGLI